MPTTATMTGPKLAACDKRGLSKTAALQSHRLDIELRSHYSLDFDRLACRDSHSGFRSRWSCVTGAALNVGNFAHAVFGNRSHCSSDHAGQTSDARLTRALRLVKDHTEKTDDGP